MLAKAFLPFALLFILAGCGQSTPNEGPAGIAVRGDGFHFEVPAGWRVTRPRGAVVARSGESLVSVTVFSLRKAYEPGQFEAVARTLDSVAGRLATAAGTTVSTSESATVAERKTRAYRYGGRRIAFVLAGAHEYQLFCSPAGSACDLLFGSFRLP